MGDCYQGQRDMTWTKIFGDNLRVWAFCKYCDRETTETIYQYNSRGVVTCRSCGRETAAHRFEVEVSEPITPPQDYLPFEEILPWLRTGEKAQKQVWEKEGWYITMTQNKFTVFSKVGKRLDYAGVEELVSCLWKIVVWHSPKFSLNYKTDNLFDCRHGLQASIWN